MRAAPASRWTAPVILAALLLPAVASACSSSTTSPQSHGTTSTTTASTVAKSEVDRTACALLPAAQVGSIMGVTVGAPTATVKSTVTTCTYKAKTLAQSVLIQYDLDTSTTQFAADRSSIQSHEGSTTSISGLGDQAYTFTKMSGSRTVTTVVTLKGSLQSVVTGTSSRQQVENLADAIINKIAAGSATTTTTAAAG